MNAATLRWPPSGDEPRLTAIESFVLIHRPAAAVFDFVANAALWHYWHPATVATLAPSRPLLAGERATETIRLGRRRFDATWTVLACEPAKLWVIATATDHGDARIVYELLEEGTMTRFFRTLAYRSRRWPWSWLDGNVTRRALVRQSETALANLKRVMESGKVPQAGTTKAQGGFPLPRE